MLISVVPGLLILSTMMVEVIQSSKMLILTVATQHHIPEDGILYYHICLRDPAAEADDERKLYELLENMNNTSFRCDQDI
jgi:hypothetical protein